MGWQATLRSFVVAAVVLALDYWTKWLVMTNMAEFEEIKLIPGFFSFQFVHNPGAAFGILAHQRWLFIGVSIIAVLAIAYFTRRPEARTGVAPWALGMLLGGAIGNLVDRMRFGQVVDFFLFYYRDWAFPNFNVADIGITIGVGLLILHMVLTEENDERESA